ncbi:SpoIIE family protein phosphatase, partial [Candidatus Bathyarchaeota archaeon]|nr:SpoIIE family protein phosphatase [Candidatus Bathyarchaeota archaeon]
MRVSLANYVARKLKDLPEPAPEGDSNAIQAAISSAFSSAFSQLDDEILSDALAALRDPVSHAEAMCRIAPASSGSCATFAVYDPTNSTVHVANAGDTRAVLVRRRESEIRSESGVIQDKDNVVDDNKKVVEDNNKVVQASGEVVKDNTEVIEDGAEVAKDDNGAKASRDD